MVLALGAVTASATTGCETKRGQGAAIGAIGGGALGAAVGGETGLLLGAAAGGALGYAAGRAMEEEDRRRFVYALERNEPVQWQNPDTGYAYAVEPIDTRYYRGRECREFRMFADVEGQPEEVYGLACRAPDGAWEIVESG